MNIKPLYDRMLVKRIAAEAVSKGGILIPDKARKKSSQGEVFAVGDGALKGNGDLRPPVVKAGDRVLFGQYAGAEVKIEGETYLILKESEIFAILEYMSEQEKVA